MKELADRGFPIQRDLLTLEETKGAIIQGLKELRGKNKMLKDITIGQYYKEDSLIHRLDPRVKLFCSLDLCHYIIYA